MKMLVFARRNAREILRDPLTAIFSLGFPVVILALLTAIQANVPVDLFRLETLTPGVTIFGLAFMTLFSHCPGSGNGAAAAAVYHAPDGG